MNSNPILSPICSLSITLILFIILKGVSGATFTIINKCDYTIWPGTFGNSQLDITGFELQPGGARSFQAPPNWSGRFWGRTGCKPDPNTGQTTCLTGDCGSNQIECNGKTAIPPATLAEFTIGSGTQDFYDVSLVDGYNLPMIVEASGGSGNCLSTGCISDLNLQCPNELKSGSGQACKSACEAFGNPEYCCSGAYGSPDTCKPSMYSEIFKSACPRSYSYAYDDATSTFTCTGADYKITFCPSSTSKNSESHTSPSTAATATTTPSTASTISGSGTVTGPGNEPSTSGDSIEWIPGFLTGDSSRIVSGYALGTTLLATTVFSISFLQF